MRCFVCHGTDDLRVAPIVTGDRFGEKPKYPICSKCLCEWYEGGHQSWDEVREAVKRKEVS